MSVMIDEGDREAWLDPELEDAERLLALLRPVPGKGLLLTPASTYVNNPRNDDPRCIEPLANFGGNG